MNLNWRTYERAISYWVQLPRDLAKAMNKNAGVVQSPALLFVWYVTPLRSSNFLLPFLFQFNWLPFLPIGYPEAAEGTFVQRFFCWVKQEEFAARWTVCVRLIFFIWFPLFEWFYEVWISFAKPSHKKEVSINFKNTAVNGIADKVCFSWDKDNVSPYRVSHIVVVNVLDFLIHINFLSILNSWVKEKFCNIRCPQSAPMREICSVET